MAKSIGYIVVGEETNPSIIVGETTKTHFVVSKFPYESRKDAEYQATMEQTRAANEGKTNLYYFVAKVSI